MAELNDVKRVLNVTTENWFQNICKLYWDMAAIMVMGEDPGTDNHANRIALAKRILTGTFSVKLMCRGVMTNQTIQTNLLNREDIQPEMAGTVSSIFDHYANAFA